MRMVRYISIFIPLLIVFTKLDAQLHEGKYKGAIYNEKDVPEYVLPDLLTGFDGNKIKSVQDWEQKRRPEIIRFFTENIYGNVPEPSDPIIKSFELVSENTAFMEGLCTRREIKITLKNRYGEVSMPLVLFVPNRSKAPVPAIFLFTGNDIRTNKLDLKSPQSYGMLKNGVPLKQLMLRGIAFIAIDGNAFGRDLPDSRQGRLRGAVVDLYFKPGQNYTKKGEWGLIAVWAHALRVGMDYIETDKAIDSQEVAVLGCSVSGKVALWAAANDNRFGMILLATAGHGGDAIWRRQFGETLENMCTYLPTWICRKANKYAKDIQRMPVDQHMLLAALAPRPLYVSNATHDLWADQKGQWIGTYNSTPSYELYGRHVAFSSSEQPPIDNPIVKSSIGYHVRSGFHGLNLYDWERYMEFIEYHFLKIPIRSVHDVYYPDGKQVNHYPNMLNAE